MARTEETTLLSQKQGMLENLVGMTKFAAARMLASVRTKKNSEIMSCCLRLRDGFESESEMENLALGK